MQDHILIDRVNLLSRLTGKSQASMAKELGINRQTLNAYLKGRRKIDEIVKKAICDYFAVPEKIFTQHTVHLVLKGDKLMIL